MLHLRHRKVYARFLCNVVRIFFNFFKKNEPCLFYLVSKGDSNLKKKDNEKIKIIYGTWGISLGRSSFSCGRSY